MIRHYWDLLLKAAQRDFVAKLAALAIAIVVVWLIRRTISEEYTVILKVQTTPRKTESVQESNLADKQLTVMKIEPSEVKVTFHGSKEQLQALRRDTDNLQIRVAPPRFGVNSKDTVETRLRRSHVEGVGSVRATFSPKFITLRQEAEVTKVVGVAKPLMTGKPLVGRAQLIWSETNVTVRGPQTQLQTLEDKAITLSTEPIDVDGRVQSFTKRVRIIHPTDLDKAILEPAEIDVTVDILVKTEPREFENIPVMVTTASGSGLVLVSDPATVKVKVIASPDQLDRIETNKIAVVADSRNIEHKPDLTVETALRVVLPSGMGSLQSEAIPGKVTITARRVDPPATTETAENAIEEN